LRSGEGADGSKGLQVGLARRMVVTKRTIALVGGVLVLIAVYANNSSILTKPIAARPLLLAHRGVHQDFPHEGVTEDTCTASRIFPPHNNFIEDTIPSMTEAFKDGADLVEFDIHPTTDGSWAVFHDWVLDCRTNGHGVTRNHALAYLKTLDVGYGYTADGGKTFPLRGQGVGLMPSLDEVLGAFPNGSFLVHIKSNDPGEGEALATKLKTFPSSALRNLMVYGGDRPISVVRSKIPDLRTMSLKTEKSCLVTYAALGWSGYIPTDCRNSLLVVPANIAHWLWGWPNKFLRRMINVGTEVFVGDDFKAGGLKGLNRPEDLRKLPKGYSGGIWTDQIDVIGPALRGRR